MLSLDVSWFQQITSKQPQSQPTNSVAFYAMMSRNEPSPGKHHTIVFDSVQTNVGNAYNNFSGVFTAPVSGVYYFAWTIANYCHAYVFTVLVVNNAEVNAIATDGEDVCDEKMSSGQVVVELAAGQIVFIRTNSRSSIKGAIKSTPYERSSFSGFRLFGVWCKHLKIKLNKNFKKINLIKLC